MASNSSRRPDPATRPDPAPWPDPVARPDPPSQPDPSSATRPARRPESSQSPAWSDLPLGSRVFVDTAPFIYLFEGHPVLAERYAGLFDAADRGALHLITSVVTVTEVLTGPYKAGLGALAHQYERTLARYEVVPVTLAVASLAARLRSEYRLPPADAMQLACALEANAVAFVTHNRDFIGVDVLRVVTA
jgi:predicted nucleic acid-binding protein